MPGAAIRAAEPGPVCEARGMNVRHTRRTGLVLALCAVALLLLASAAWPASKAPVRTFTTGTFVVTCTSTGQVCSPPETLHLAVPRRGTMTSLRYTTSPLHCSALALQIVRGAKVLATSGRIEAGTQTLTQKTSIAIPKGASTLGFRAVGYPGGCNVGRVGSWGGKITVTVRLRRP